VNEPIWRLPAQGGEVLGVSYFTLFSPFAEDWPTRGAATGRKEFGFRFFSTQGIQLGKLFFFVLF